MSRGAQRSGQFDEATSHPVVALRKRRKSSHLATEGSFGLWPVVSMAISRTEAQASSEAQQLLSCGQ